LFPRRFRLTSPTAAALCAFGLPAGLRVYSALTTLT